MKLQRLLHMTGFICKKPIFDPTRYGHTVELQHYHHVHNYAGFLVCFEDNHGVILLYLLPPGPNTVDSRRRM